MNLKTTLGLLAGRSSHFILSRLGRGSTLPGKVALQFDKDILQNLAKNYEIVVVTGTNGKTLTTALTVGILKEVYGQVLTNPSGANMITGIATTFLTAKSSKTGKILPSSKLTKPVYLVSVTISSLVFLSLLISSVTRWTVSVKSILPIT